MHLTMEIITDSFLGQLPSTMGGIHTAHCLVLVIKTFSKAVVFFNEIWNLALRKMSS